MNILITGASRGIGFNLVKQFATLKDNHVIAVSRNSVKLQQLQQECKLELDQNVQICPQDLEDSRFLEIHKSIENLSHLDVVICNAGLLINKPFHEMELDEWRKLFEVNVFSTVTLLKSLFPLLKQSSNPHVVFISSMGGLQGSKKFSGLSGYSAAKGTLTILAECLAEEWKKDNISVNCLCLGAVNTEMLQEAFPGYQAPVEPWDMAKYIYQFAVEAHHFMNGRIIPVALSDPD